jgi:hypothetical protein
MQVPKAVLKQDICAKIQKNNNVRKKCARNAKAKTE